MLASRFLSSFISQVDFYLICFQFLGLREISAEVFLRIELPDLGETYLLPLAVRVFMKLGLIGKLKAV
jgi:hypothetical protein